MTVTPRLSRIKDDALRYKQDAPGHQEPWDGEFCGMINWLLITGADITPGSTLVCHGLGHVTPDHEDAAGHLLGYIHAHQNHWARSSFRSTSPGLECVPWRTACWLACAPRRPARQLLAEP